MRGRWLWGWRVDATQLGLIVSVTPRVRLGFSADIGI
jgi:hypothetical protein